MISKKLRIQGNLPSDRYWLLNWVGEIQKMKNNKPGCSLKFNFVPLLDNYMEINRPALRLDRQENAKAVEIDASYLRYLPVGSIWKNSDNGFIECVKDSTGKQVDFKSVEISESSLRIFSPYDKDPSTSDLIVGYNDYPMFNQQYPSYCLGIHHNNDPYKIIIPCSEVLRAYYSFSDRFLQAVLGGWFQSNSNKLFQLSKTFINGDGIYEVWPQPDFRQRNALSPLVNMYFDPLARTRTLDIYKKIQVAHANSKVCKLQALPPYNGVSNLSLIGQWIPGRPNPYKPGSNYYRFLVHRIVRCTLEPPILNYRYHRLIAASNESAGSNDIDIVNMPPLVRTSIDEVDNIDLKHDIPPNKAKVPIEFMVPGAILEGYNNVKCERIDHEREGEWRERRGEMIESPTILEVSSGDGRYNSEDPVPGSFLISTEDDCNFEEINPKRFENLIKALEFLRAEYLEPSFKTVDVICIPYGKHQIETPWMLSSSKAYTSLFPNYIDNEFQTWSYLDQEQLIRRQLLIVKIIIDDKCIMIFEGEKAESSEGMAIQMATLKHFREWTRDDIDSVVACCIRSQGCWLPKKELSHIGRQRLNHVKEDDEFSIARRLFKQISETIVRRNDTKLQNWEDNFDNERVFFEKAK